MADVTTDQQDLGQQMMITVDRDAAARFGLDISTIIQDLYDAFGQRQIATIYGPIYQYKVILEVSSGISQYRGCAPKHVFPEPTPPVARDRLADHGVRQHRGTPPPVPLAAFAKLEKRLAPLIITHQNEFPAVALSFNLAPGVSLGQALETVRRTQAAIGLARSDRYAISSAAPRNSSPR